MQALRLLAAHLARLWFPSPDDTVHSALSSPPTAERTPSEVPGFWSTGAPLTGSSSRTETTRPPKFPGSPGVHMPRSRTPVGRRGLAFRDPDARPSMRSLAFHFRNSVGPHEPNLTRLNHTACALAVYASPRRSPDVAQDSLRGGGQPPRRDWVPAGLHREVSVWALPPLHQGFPGAILTIPWVRAR